MERMMRMLQIVAVLAASIFGVGEVSAQTACQSQYADPAILEYCAETASECTLRASTTGGNSCEVLCQSGGGVCLGAFNDNPDGSCNPGDGLLCESDGFPSMLCVCSLTPADPCDPNPCTLPPEAECSDAVTLLEYEPIGTCTNLGGGTFSCDYGTPVAVDCSAQGLVCREGACAANADVPSLSELALGIIFVALVGAGLWALRPPDVADPIP